MIIVIISAERERDRKIYKEKQKHTKHILINRFKNSNFAVIAGNTKMMIKT